VERKGEKKERKKRNKSKEGIKGSIVCNYLIYLLERKRISRN